MSKLKRKTKVIVITFLVLFFTPPLVFLWVNRWSPRAVKAQKNVENSLKLKVGMSQNKLIEVMGKPYSIRYRDKKRDSVFFYMPPFAASSGIDIVVRGDSIYQIYLYE